MHFLHGNVHLASTGLEHVPYRLQCQCANHNIMLQISQNKSTLYTNSLLIHEEDTMVVSTF